jgi:hypothetical protein
MHYAVTSPPCYIGFSNSLATTHLGGMLMSQNTTTQEDV